MTNDLEKNIGYVVEVVKENDRGYGLLGLVEAVQSKYNGNGQPNFVEVASAIGSAVEQGMIYKINLSTKYGERIVFSSEPTELSKAFEKNSSPQ